MRVLASFAAAVGVALSLAVTSVLAQPVDQQYPSFYGHFEGMYAVGNQGEGTIQDPGIPPLTSDVKPGDGWGIHGLLGFRFDEVWDFALSGGHVDLSKGKSDGNPLPNTFGVDDASTWNIDGTIGYNLLVMAPAQARVFGGVRYREWDHDFQFRPDVPLGCCGLQSETWGVGPLAGFSGSVPIDEALSIFGGAEVAVLFGKTRFRQLPAVGVTSGSSNRTMVDLGAHLGLNLLVADNVELGAGYRVLWTSGATYKNRGLLAFAVGPSGSSDALVHGPFGRLSIKLN